MTTNQDLSLANSSSASHAPLTGDITTIICPCLTLPPFPCITNATPPPLLDYHHFGSKIFLPALYERGMPISISCPPHFTWYFRRCGFIYSFILSASRRDQIGSKTSLREAYSPRKSGPPAGLLPAQERTNPGLIPARRPTRGNTMPMKRHSPSVHYE